MRGARTNVKRLLIRQSSRARALVKLFRTETEGSTQQRMYAHMLKNIVVVAIKSICQFQLNTQPNRACR